MLSIEDDPFEKSKSSRERSWLWHLPTQWEGGYFGAYLNGPHKLIGLMKSDYDGEGLSHDLLHTAPRHFKFKFFPRLAFTHGHVYFIFYIGASLGHQSIFGWQSSKQKRYFFMLSCTAHLLRIYKQENIVSVQLDWIGLACFSFMAMWPFAFLHMSDICF